MSILDELSDVSVWERFYEYKSGLVCPDRLKRELRRFIDSRGYIPVCESIALGCDFPLPQKSIISKQSTQKKRVVYTYPDAHNRVLKLLTYIMLRRNDGLFADNLFSFRPGRTAKDAIMSLLRVRGVGEMYSYKADISNYFNSIDIERLLPLLKNAMGDDEELYAFLKRLLEEPYVLENGERIKERKGIMAGTPLASFYANLFLTELDRHFEKLGVPYCRYSDDIILFAKTREGAQGHAETVRSFLKENGLELNPDKERFSSPDEGFVFLGFSYRHGVIDIAPASLDKLKHKMRRKTRALARWRDRNGIEVLSASTLVITGRTKDALTEQTVALGLVGSVIDGLRLSDLTIRIFQDLFRRSKTNGNLREIILNLYIFLKSHNSKFLIDEGMSS